MAASVSHKSSNVQLFRLMLYNRPLHPELFDLQTRSACKTNDYETESWLVPAGHVVRFQQGDFGLTETVIECGDHLPEHGLVHALPCLGEKDFNYEPVDGFPLAYVTTIQTEGLTDNLYQATYREMIDFAEETGSIMHAWVDGEGAECLSVLDAQKYKREFHIQSYHLLGASGMVLRSQSIFELLARR